LAHKVELHQLVRFFPQLVVVMLLPQQEALVVLVQHWEFVKPKRLLVGWVLALMPVLAVAQRVRFMVRAALEVVLVVVVV
jgi:hypothetical protein